jgi:ribosomal-protein-alanine N-acetyltransferase
MTADDTAGVAAMEALSQPSPWPEHVFAGELDRDWAHVDVARFGRAGPLVAFCNYWLVAGELQLLNLATHPAWRRRGIAAMLMNHLLAVARARHCRQLVLEVRLTNHPAQALYAAHGFTTVGRRAGYYADNGEDALVMLLDLGEQQSAHLHPPH